MSLRDHHRFEYSPITRRADFDWPGGKRLAVYIGLNLEHFAFGEGLGGELAPGGPAPDVLNYAWREYGNRVGVWRMLDLFESLDMPVSLLVNSALYEHCPEVVAAFRARGDEIVGHGRTNAERQGTLSEDEEPSSGGGTVPRCVAPAGEPALEAEAHNEAEEDEASRLDKVDDGERRRRRRDPPRAAGEGRELRRRLARPRLRDLLRALR